MKLVKLVFILLVGVMLSSCSYPIDLEAVETAKEMCEPNDGLRIIHIDLGYYTITCNNGMFLKMHKKTK